MKRPAVIALGAVALLAAVVRPVRAAEPTTAERIEDLARGADPVARRALRALGRDPAAREALEEALGSWEGGVARGARTALDWIEQTRPKPARGPEEIPALLAAVKAGGEARLDALVALGECPARPEVIEALLSALQGGDDDAIWQATQGLRRLEVTPAVERAVADALARALKAGRDPGDLLAVVRSKALDGVAPVLLDALQSGPAEHRAAVAESLEPLALPPAALARVVGLLPGLEPDAARAVVGWLLPLYPEADLAPAVAAARAAGGDVQMRLLEAMLDAPALPRAVEALALELAAAEPRGGAVARTPGSVAVEVLVAVGSRDALHALAAGDVVARERLLSLVGWPRRGERAIDALIDGLSPARVRDLAGCMPLEEREKAAALWARVLADPQEERTAHAAAALALALLGEPGLKALVESVTAGPERRQVALRCLAGVRLPRADAWLGDALGFAVRDGDIAFESRLLLAHAPARALAVLLLTIGLVEKADAPHRASVLPVALAALGECVVDRNEADPERLAARIAPFLGDAQVDVRAQAARALGRLGAKGATEKLLAVLRDPEPTVREEAALALARIADPAARDALAALLAKPLDGLSARYTLGDDERGGGGEDPDDYEKRFAMQGPDPREQLAAGLRVTAAVALHALGDDAAQAGIDGYFDALDAAMERQVAAGWGGVQIIPPAGRALPQAAVALAERGDERGIAWLVHFLDRPYVAAGAGAADGASWRLVEALRAVAKGGAPDGGVTPEAFARDPWPTVRAWRVWWRARKGG